MCTLTLIPRGSHDYRLAFNRDESRSRAAASPPQVDRFGERTAILPIDPASGGTWLAVNDAGLVLALLNVNPPEPSSRHRPHSRGLIIPGLLACDSLDETTDAIEELAVEGFPPFRLIAIHEDWVAEWKHDGSSLVSSGAEVISKPMMFTSSGLGDNLVEQPRRELFEAAFADAGALAAVQDAFHRHSWPQRQHLSVCMRRSDACTVSFTVIEWNDQMAVMKHHPAAPDEPAPAAMSQLLFEQPSVS